MKIFIKPIQFTNLKEEIVIEINPEKLVSDLILKLIESKPEVPQNLDFMFRGKKLLTDKPLSDQGIKEGTKLMMYLSEVKPEKINKQQEVESNKNSAKNKLISMGYKEDIINSVIKTIPNIENLSSESICEKSLVFLKAMTKETLSEYSLEIDSNLEMIIDEEKISSIFTMGDGIQGQLGIGKYIKSDFPMRVNKLRNVKIKKIACGVYHTVALTTYGHGKKKFRRLINFFYYSLFLGKILYAISHR
jgi:hypothetical protein